MKKRKTQWSEALQSLTLPAVGVAALLFFATAVGNLNSDRNTENRKQLEDTLRRGCVACYAAEGIYPPDLVYLEDHYGIQVDETRYVVHYEIFADNLMPDVTVLEKKS